MAIAPTQAQAATETVLHNFATPPKGAYPYAGLIRDAAGNLYGTTNSRGKAGAGVVFKVSTSGHQTVLYNFTGGVDGGYPQAGVIRDAAGNLYGTTAAGGTAGAGVVYKLDTSDHETVLYTFTGGDDGGLPDAAVIRDSAGNLYGTTSAGGTADWGTVYKLDTTGHETVLHNFTGGADGGLPFRWRYPRPSRQPLRDHRLGGSNWGRERGGIQGGYGGQRDSALQFHGLHGRV
jgi:uncharacterized repeat protein (TIGR03803 family)